MKLLAENRGKGKTQMLSDTVACALMLCSLLYPHERMP